MPVTKVGSHRSFVEVLSLGTLRVSPTPSVGSRVLRNHRQDLTSGPRTSRYKETGSVLWVVGHRNEHFNRRRSAPTLRGRNRVNGWVVDSLVRSGDGVYGNLQKAPESLVAGIPSRGTNGTGSNGRRGPRDFLDRRGKG